MFVTFYSVINLSLNIIYLQILFSVAYLYFLFSGSLFRDNMKEKRDYTIYKNMEVTMRYALQSLKPADNKPAIHIT